MKLNSERLWWLGRWQDGWSIGDPIRCNITKWRNHTDALVKMGLLEVDAYGTYHKTDAGKAALAEQERVK